MSSIKKKRETMEKCSVFDQLGFDLNQLAVLTSEIKIDIAPMDSVFLEIDRITELLSSLRIAANE